MPDKQMAIERAWRRAGAGGERPIMIGIAGDSASGKTTLTRGLVAALGADRITAICVDDYHRYDRVERKGLPFTALHPAGNYVDVMEQHLQLLALGQPVLKPVYNHDTGTLDRPVLVEPSEFVIAEGLLPLHTRLARACFDVTVYLDPPEVIRRRWKLRRDVAQRGYSEAEVDAELARREPESAAYIRPQRAHADIVIRFAPIEERGETPDDPLSAYVLLRPTIAHPDLSGVISDDTRKAAHLKLLRDEDGKPVDALHVHAYAERSLTDRVEMALWRALQEPEPLPSGLGRIAALDAAGPDGAEARSEPLAVVQLLLLFHVFQARGPERAMAASSVPR
ncbi:MAG TPA: phosphoribulokinase [Acidimicrobiia bacterium]|nr:phosphoribulokinase [Acidimicrobiia bacterium]HZQ77729.1 phosphoribulokinase [Acidimicrobiia bacterium]